MDVTEATFEKEVLERSHELPVLVDFWAEWCAPCRQLAPLLERAVAQRAGKVALVKVDVDSNQRLAQSYRVSGIPAVKAFRDGKVVSEFVGLARPEAIERLLDDLVPSEADELAQTGDEASLRRALELEPAHAQAALALARILVERSEDAEALEILKQAPGNFAADGLAAQIHLRQSPEGHPAEVHKGLEALDAGHVEAALDLLLRALPSADGARDDIRRVVVGVLDELGAEHPLAREARRRLAAALY